MPKTKAQTDEHPTIFGGWSVRRMLVDEKIQTRRIVKPQPEMVGTGVWAYKGLTFHSDETMRSRLFRELYRGDCKYGKADRLWVREAFRLPEWADDVSPAEYVSDQRKDAGEMPVRYEADGRAAPFHDRVTEEGWGRKRPSIHMPRELCRLRLRVEQVWVEQLHEINTEDVIAEGIGIDKLRRMYSARGLSLSGSKSSQPAEAIPKRDWQRAFKWLWNDVHGAGAWEENLWVKVITFTKLDE